jgi:hypothetical protein
MTEQDATKIATNFMAEQAEEHHRVHKVSTNCTYHHVETALRPHRGAWIAVFEFRSLSGHPIDGPVAVVVDPVTGNARFAD